MRLLLTGFETFGGDVINSSEETVKAVACGEFDGIEVVTGTLPVSFKRAGTEICRLIDETEPDVVIMLGQSGKSDCIKIERVALNLMDSSKGDNDGYISDEETICPGAPVAYFTKMPVKALRDCLIQSGIPAKVSNSAGLYVCNRTYFAALHCYNRQKYQSRLYTPSKDFGRVAGRKIENGDRDDTKYHRVIKLAKCVEMVIKYD